MPAASLPSGLRTGARGRFGRRRHCCQHCGRADNAAAAVAGSTPSAIAAQQGAPPAVAGLGTPDFGAVPTSPAAASTPRDGGRHPDAGLPDPRLSVPGAALAGTAQPAAPQNAAAQAGRSHGGLRQTRGSGTSDRPQEVFRQWHPSAALPFQAATGLTPAANGTAVPGRRFGCAAVGYRAATGGLRLRESLGGRFGRPNTSPTASWPPLRTGHRGCPGECAGAGRRFGGRLRRRR